MNDAQASLGQALGRWGRLRVPILRVECTGGSGSCVYRSVDAGGGWIGGCEPLPM